MSENTYLMCRVKRPIYNILTRKHRKTCGRKNNDSKKYLYHSASFRYLGCHTIKNKIMSCRSFEDKLILYIESELSDDDAKKVENHLAQCNDCTQKYNYLLDTLSTIDTEKEATPKPFLYTRIQARQSATHKPRIGWAVQSAWITAVLVIGIIIGITVGRTTIPTNTENSNYTVAYLFDDTKIERLEYQLLNDDEQ